MGVEPYDYDLAVSFAGAQRPYVEEFVQAAKELGLRVFYDRDMTVAYWGRNFIYEFRKVYGGKVAWFIMPFFSAEYLRAPYPLDEFAAAVEQEFRRDGETYILPVLFGDIKLPPELVNPAIGRMRADRHTPAELAQLTVQRLGLAAARTPATVRLPKLTVASFDAAAALSSVLVVVGQRFEHAAPTLDRYGYSCRVDSSDEAVQAQVYEKAAPVCGLNLWRDTSFGSDRLAMSFAWPVGSRAGMNGWATAAWDPASDAAVVDFTDLSAGSGGRRLSTAQFFDVLWDKIIDFLERRVG